MQIVINSENPKFNTEIANGDFIEAKHISWRNPKNAIIVSRTDGALLAYYAIKGTAALGHFCIRIDEAVADEWLIKIEKALPVG